MTRLPVRTPSATVPCSQTGVDQVYAGPSSSRPAKVVTSFISDAGLTGLSGCQARRGRAASASCTHATIASRGTPPRESAASTLRGRPRTSLPLFNARAVAVAALTAGGSQAASSDVVSAMIGAARRRGGAVEARDRDRMAPMIAWAKRANGRERRR